jgi:hypothetical protein
VRCRRRDCRGVCSCQLPPVTTLVDKSTQTPKRMMVKKSNNTPILKQRRAVYFEFSNKIQQSVQDVLAIVNVYTHPQLKLSSTISRIWYLLRNDDKTLTPGDRLTHALNLWEQLTPNNRLYTIDYIACSDKQELDSLRSVVVDEHPTWNTIQIDRGIMCKWIEKRIKCENQQMT